MKEYKDITTIYSEEMGQVLNAKQRVTMTVRSGFVCDDIPKVKNAGKTKTIDGKKHIIMHDGSLMKQSGYVGGWMDEIITSLNGHHEPQEEKAFHEILKRIDSKQPTMIELGAYWAYYSIWFCRTLKNARAFSYEPNPPFLNIGKHNAAVNKVNIHFERAAAGAKDEIVTNHPANPKAGAQTPIKTVDTIVKEHKIENIDVLHMDIQGTELEALNGAKKAIDAGKVRFVVVSTHHHSISGDPQLHKKCLDFITKHKGTIVCDHTIYESFSGDGLIVASFDKRDKDFRIEMPINRSGETIFTTPEHNIERLSALYTELRNELMNIPPQPEEMGVKNAAKQLANSSKHFAKKKYHKLKARRSN